LLVEYEQEGCDRAKYGARLLPNLADKLSIKGLDRQLLNACRMFYVKYPQICETASHKFETPPELLVTRLSFSHIKEIMPIEDPMERFFYELECIKGTWNVRELRRQIKLFRDFLDEAGFEILEVVGAVRDLNAS
jgi:Uncharacterized conserved protein